MLITAREFLLVQLDEDASCDGLGGQRLPFSFSDPSHKDISSGWQSAVILSIQSRTFLLAVGLFCFGVLLIKFVVRPQRRRTCQNQLAWPTGFSWNAAIFLPSRPLLHYAKIKEK